MRKLLLAVSFLMIFSSALHAQLKEVSGNITNSSGAPIPGATVTVIGEKRGLSATGDGSFSIHAAPHATLVISAFLIKI